MNIDDRQEYYDLIEEEIQFTAEKRQKWLLTFEERHTFGHDIVFHVYTEKGDTVLLVFEIIDVANLDVEKRLHKLTETMSGNFRILMSTLRRELPDEVKSDAFARDGSRFQLKLAHGKEEKVYEWELPVDNFKRIQPVLKLIWGIDQWRAGAEAMGWKGKELRTGNSPAAKSKPGTQSKGAGERSKGKRENSSSKGRLDPFGSIWKPSS